jgi:hypothetical protein
MSDNKKTNLIDLILKHSSYPSKCFNEDMEEFHCSICQEVVRDPVNFNCSHFNCLKCVSQMKEYKCPCCREPFDDTLKLNFYIAQKIITKPFKCLLHEQGCDWIGTIGVKEQTINDHLNECKFSKFFPCTKCTLLTNSLDEEEHKKICLEEDDECSECQEKMSRKKLFIHQAIGQMQETKCVNRYKCGLCEKHVEDLNKHLTECEKNFEICYGCKVIHFVSSSKFNEHLKSILITPDDAINFFNRMNIPLLSVGCVCLYIDLIKKVEIVKITHVLGGQMIYKCREIKENLTDEDTFFTTNLLYDLQKKRHILNDVDEIIKNCLLNFKCTFQHTEESRVLQPFYICNTCNTSDSYNLGYIGCCAACAIICHQGHDIHLNNLDMNNSFCDCGDGKEYKNPCKCMPIKKEAHLSDNVTEEKTQLNDDQDLLYQMTDLSDNVTEEKTQLNDDQDFPLFDFDSLPNDTVIRDFRLIDPSTNDVTVIRDFIRLEL